MTTILLYTDSINIQPGKYVLSKLKKYIQNIKNKVLKSFQGRYSIISWFVLAFLAIVAIIVLLPRTVNKTYEYSEIVDNIYPEIYGLLFDVILFGIVISIYHIATDKKKAIEDERDQIDDFRAWKSNEASHRILGSIKRLQRLNVFNVDLSSCWFKDITLRDLCFVDSKMTGLFLFDTEIYNTTFHNIKSNIFHCRDSKISGCSFQKGKINFNLHTSDISSTLFHDIDISSASFFTENLSFVLFDKVNFSHSFFKFKKCSYVEFVDCKFDECIVDDYFFREISNPSNCNLGYQKIMNEYDLIQEVNPRSGSTTPIWILRNKKTGNGPRPVHRIEPSAAIIMNDPWMRVGRCKPNFEINQTNDGH
jgi:hypothetical protein